jgi:hypothetical protein
MMWTGAAGICDQNGKTKAKQGMQTFANRVAWSNSAQARLAYRTEVGWHFIVETEERLVDGRGKHGAATKSSERKARGKAALVREPPVRERFALEMLVKMDQERRRVWRPRCNKRF